MSFKRLNRSGADLASPVSMYADIRPRKISNLYSQQAVTLQTYADAFTAKKDVAVHLPTGSGKTLVGLCISEWRRRKFNERVLYLCPTNQLVRQVSASANDTYGIRAKAFVGPVRDYDKSAKSEWNLGNVIGVSSYSALFNSNPFFSEPHFIICDDIHAAEQYISSYFSVNILRAEHPDLFMAITAILSAVVPALEISKLREEGQAIANSGWVDMLPVTRYSEILPSLIACLDERTPDLKLRYPWTVIREHLSACNLFLGPGELLIRPYISPTITFNPFAGASQRLYMSATAGKGGELERVSGVGQIDRITAPAGFDKQVIGRRVFLFPGRSINDSETNALIYALISKHKRAVALSTSDSTAEILAEKLRSNCYAETINGHELESRKPEFASEQARPLVAVIANRYDGIDFPGDESHILIIDGLPKAINLQEQFLVNRTSSVAVLADRIRTRIVQAVGRCTRSDNDYCLVLVIGDEMLTYLEKREGREYLDVELQAELLFGSNQSVETTAENLLEIAEVFLSQGPKWAEVNSDIVSLRSDMVAKEIPCQDDLTSSARLETLFCYAIWNGDYVTALARCKELLPHLKQGSPVRGYDGLFTYFAGCAAWHAAEGNLEFKKQAVAYFEAAAKIIPYYRWLSRPSLLGAGTSNVEADPALLEVIYRLEQQLVTLGTLHDKKFEQAVSKIEEGLASNEAPDFEAGHQRLGELLGYDSRKSKKEAAPDPFWIADEGICFVFEDHSDATSKVLDVGKARQLHSHPTWIKKEVEDLIDSALIVTVLISPVTAYNRDGEAFLANASIWPLSEFRQWASDALLIIRELRESFTGSSDLVWQARAADAYKAKRLDPKGLEEFFLNSKLLNKLELNSARSLPLQKPAT